MDKITLITATYNSAKTVHDTLRSINEQTYPNIEHIVVDGASADSTLEIVKRDGKRLSTIICEKDKGLYDAYNKGLAVATGDIVGFLNSDDFYCSKTVIERVMNLFERNKDIEACYADLVYVDRENTNKITRHWKSENYYPGAFKYGFVPAHPTLFLRRSVYERAGYFDLSYKFSADYEFMLRIFQRFDVRSVYIPEIIVKMRNGGTTGGSLLSIVKQNSEIMASLDKHGVRFSRAGYVARKIVDRTVQMIRAGSVDLGTPVVTS